MLLTKGEHLSQRVKEQEDPVKEYLKYRKSINSAILDVLGQNKDFVAGAKGIERMSKRLGNLLFSSVPQRQRSRPPSDGAAPLLSGGGLGWGPGKNLQVWNPSSNPSGAVTIDPFDGKFTLDLKADPGDLTAWAGFGGIGFTVPTDLNYVQFHALFSPPPEWNYKENAALYGAHTHGSISYDVDVYDQSGNYQSTIATYTFQLFSDSVGWYDHHEGAWVQGDLNWGFPDTTFFSLSANQLYAAWVYASISCYADHGTFGHATSGAHLEVDLQSYGVSWPG
jgi:hypothetical protein